MTSSFAKLPWEDAGLQARIADGIERHRKQDFVVQLLGANGMPEPGVDLQLRQTGSEFRFGANLFMLGGYSTPAENSRYEEAFLNLFNAATVPFYWRGLQPTPVTRRHAANSARLARRPPPETTLEFCEAHQLDVHGHPLVWDSSKWMVPDWLGDDQCRRDEVWREHVQDLGKRYGHRIRRWDALNEPLTGGPVPARSRPMPLDYEAKAFGWAAEAFPPGTQFDVNENSLSWGAVLSRYGQLVERLRKEGQPIGGVGLQFHLFSDDEMLRLARGEIHRGDELLAALDALAVHGLPLHVSEITLPAPAGMAEGDKLQADCARYLYSLWFSHPAVSRITWWNIPDRGAAVGEDGIASGLLNENLEPKPAYWTLHDLIHREWRTATRGSTDAQGAFRFRGFPGEYEVFVRGRRAAQKIVLGGPALLAACTVSLTGAS